jgi:hypothetical protein
MKRLLYIYKIIKTIKKIIMKKLFLILTVTVFIYRNRASARNNS